MHVVDASDEQADLHCHVVYETLKELEVTGKPVITLWNKCDLLEEDQILTDFRADVSVRISAKTGEGIPAFYEELEKILRERRRYVDIVLPYSLTGVVAQIRKYGQLLSEEYEAEGIHITAYVPPEIRLPE